LIKLLLANIVNTTLFFDIEIVLYKKEYHFAYLY